MAYQITAPLTLTLSELPDEGRSFSYQSDENPEMKAALSEVFGDNDFAIEVFLTPAGDTYHMTGQIRGKRDLLCSRCAADVKFEVKEEIDEFFSTFSPTPSRIDHSARVNHRSDLKNAASDWTTLQGEELDLAAYFREIVLANEPLQITKNPPCDDTCPELQRAQKQGWLQEQDKEAKPNSPFAKLKELKLN